MHPVCNDTGSRAFCGPTVLAGITGQPISVVKNAIRRGRYGDRYDTMHRRPPIMGTGLSELKRALELLGFELFKHGRYYSRPQRPTLARWFKTRSDDERQHYVIVNVTHHWVLVKGNMFLDTFSKGEPVRIGKAPGRRKRVVQTYLVRKTRRVTKAEIEALESKAILREEGWRKLRRKSENADRAKIVALGGKPKVYDEIGCKYVTVTFDPPAHGWIKEIETMHYDWAETYDRVQLALDNPDEWQEESSEPGKLYVSL